MSARAEARGSLRRGSVLVLVMTVLGMLFVMGVAFLATMNFEAERQAAEARQQRTGAGAENVSADAAAFLASGLMSNSEQPFSAAPAGAALASFATLPGWHNVTSPIEPQPIVQNGQVVSAAWPWFADLEAAREPGGVCKDGPYNGHRCLTARHCNNTPNMAQWTGVCEPVPFGGPHAIALALQADLPNATTGTISRCIGGLRDGLDCETTACPDGVCLTRELTVIDADGDGIVDSLLIEASRLGYSPEQIAQLSAAVNPASNPDGNVYVALRIIPHGGMVNLNDAHPRLIEAAFGIPDIFLAYNVNAGNYYHRPAQDQVFYSPLQEEPVLRRRNFFPPRTLPPTRLQGDPNVAGMGTGILSDRNVWGDFPEHLFPPRAGQAGIFEHAINGTHRYWPTRPFETITPDSPPLWQVRMEPITAFSSRLGEHYDRRHLVTTTSHDDLLARGGTVRMNGRALDVREAMMRVNEAFNHPLCDGTLPFEYANYPRDIINNSKTDGQDCWCDALANCNFDRRKGRLKLSLPWLDEAIERWKQGDTETGISGQRLQRLIYDAFYMMLLNAAGPAWENKECITDNECLAIDEPTPGREFCGVNLQTPICIDRVLNLPRRDAKITRTAASLTANMLDYMDDGVCLLGRNDGLPCRTNADCPGGGTCPLDDMPTRVAVRYLTFDGGMCRPINPTGPVGPHNGAFCREDMDCQNDPSDPYFCATFGDNDAVKTCEGGADHGKWCSIPSDCLTNPQRPGSCVSILGREINVAAEPRIGRGWEFAHGIERQPFITEVTTVQQQNGLVGWAVELFNPYDDPIDLTLYSLVEIDDNNNIRPNSIPLPGTIQPQQFVVYYWDTVGYFQNLPPSPEGVFREISGSIKPTFEKDWDVALVLDAAYANPSNPIESVIGRIVVDQVGIEGQYIGDPDPDRTVFDPPLNPIDLLVATRQRAVSVSGIPGARVWTAPIGNSVELWGSPNTTPPSDPQLLGQSNLFADQKAHPVEIQLADAGSFTRPNPNMGNVPDRRNEVAFPTTGSMLTMMRHSNRSLGFFGIETARTHRNHLAFTTALNEEITISDPNTGGQLAEIREREQIDNGRMPVFDRGVLTGTAPNQLRYAAHHVPAWQSPAGRPGGVENLPWGQLVFDYFTALPLSNPGPYRVRNPDELARDDAQPRVDQRGLRVHGRIDLNAAPWTVLSGLPFIPMEKIPLTLRTRFEENLYDWPGQQTPQRFAAGSLFDFGPDNDRDGLARAIVAYREMREGFSEPIPGQPVTSATGDFSQAGFGRGWFDPNPAFRRGTGFLTVGELANLRHAANIVPGNYRIDGRLVVADPDDPDGDGIPGPSYDASADNYLDAIAVLASLGDWVTVRSQVFTVYGVIRGEADPDAFLEFGDAEAVMRGSEAVDARALRFQETVDRLPTFLGETLPRRIGDRTLARYRDTTSD